MPSAGSEAAAFDKAHRNISAVIDAGVTGGRAALPLVGVEATNLIKVLVTGPSPSAPGGPPGLVFGGLRLSYGWDTGGVGHQHHVDIGSDAAARRPITGEAVDYAKYLEEGAGPMAPRPHLRPAMAIMVPLIGPMISRSITTAQRARAASLRGTSIGH